MKFRSQKIGIFLGLFALVLTLGIPLGTSAGEVKVESSYTLRKGEAVSDDLYTVGNNITISGDVNGELFAIGTNVFSGSNSIKSDAFVISATANILSEIGGALRVVGAKAYFDGTTGKDLVAVAQEIQLLPQSKVGGDLIAEAGRAVLNGEVKGSVKIGGGEVYLGDKVSGSVNITADKIVIADGAVISGELVYSSANPIVISPNAKILGQVTQKPIKTSSSLEKFLPTIWGTWALIHFIVLLLSALILHGFLRNISTHFVSISVTHFWKSLLRGFLFVIAVPVIIAMVFLTFIGIPFGLLGLAIYTIVLVFAYIYTPIVTGSLIHHLFKMDDKTNVNWKTITVGVFFTVILGYVPYVGWIIKYAIMLSALGGIYQALSEKFREVR